MKAPGSTGEGHWKLGDLSAEEESGIPCVAVKCVDIWRNTSGEGGSLFFYVGSSGLRIIKKEGLN